MTSLSVLQSATPWAEVVLSQDGVISRRQARLGGLSEDAWQWRLDTGRWRALLPGVAVVHSGEATARQCAWAAVLCAGPGAALTADAALCEQGMRLPAPAVLDVAVPQKRAVVARPLPAAGEGGRVVPHRVRRLQQYVHPVRVPPVVRVAPALLHAAAWAVSDRAAEWRVAAAVQQRLLRPADVRRELDGVPRRPRAGLVRTVLDDVELGAHAASELAFLRFLRQYELSQPDRLQRLVRTGAVCYLDAWWERQRVAVEIDGAHHRLVGTWDADLLRANSVVVEERGDRILLLRFTTGNLRHDSGEVAGQLRLALA